MRPVIEDLLYIAQGVDNLPLCDTFRLLNPKGLDYHPFCDDFGPVNTSAVIRFVKQLQDAHPRSRRIYNVGSDSRANGAVLVGAYMILILDKRTTEVLEIFDWLDETNRRHYFRYVVALWSRRRAGCR